VRAVGANFPNIMISTYGNAYEQANGLWMPYGAQHQPWMVDYGAYAFGLAAGLCEDSGAIATLNNYFTWYNHVFTTFGGWQMYAYIDLVFDTGTLGSAISGGTNWITSDTLFAGVAPFDSASWTNAAPGVFTCVNIGSSGYIVTAGDKWIFSSIDYRGNTAGAPGGFSTDTPYYVVSPSGVTCSLSASPGGSPITTTNSGSLNNVSIGVIATNTVANSGFSDSTGTYMVAKQGALRYMQAVGISGLTAMQSDNAGRLSNSPYNKTTDPKWAMVGGF
jgi:hypothetical protein